MNIYQHLEENEKTGIIRLDNTADIEYLLQSNKDELDSIPLTMRVSDTASKGGFRKVASIPIESMMALGESGTAAMNGDQNELRKIINENPHFRVNRGRI